MSGEGLSGGRCNGCREECSTCVHVADDDGWARSLLLGGLLVLWLALELGSWAWRTLRVVLR